MYNFGVFIMGINSVIYKNLYCKKDNLIIPVGSDNWFNWLLINKSFHYQYESLHCHFQKDKKGYWTAIKIIDKKRRAKRMGISYDLTVENMLSVVYQLNLTQSDYGLLQQNRKQHSIKDSRTWLKFEIEEQHQEISQLKKQVRELELKLNEDRQNQEIIKLKNLVKELRSKLRVQQSSNTEYIDINSKMIPVFCDG